MIVCHGEDRSAGAAYFAFRETLAWVRTIPGFWEASTCVWISLPRPDLTDTIMSTDIWAWWHRAVTAECVTRRMRGSGLGRGFTKH